MLLASDPHFTGKGYRYHIQAMMMQRKQVRKVMQAMDNLHANLQQHQVRPLKIERSPVLT